jgi:hypothetical protein
VSDARFLQTVNADEAEQRLPETGIPAGIQRGAVEMDSLQYFEPNLSGPATRDTPFSADKDSAGEEEPEQDESTHASAESGCPRAPDALIAEENANAEFLIGLDGAPDDDPVGKLASLRAKVQLAEDVQKRITAATLRVQQAGAAEHVSDTAMDAAADLAALGADHKSIMAEEG